jgi:hypothetical protein
MEIVGARGLGVPAEQTQPLAWKDLIESPLPETGDRSISVLRAAWKTSAAKAIFSYAWTWPGQLILEYRETLIS